MRRGAREFTSVQRGAHRRRTCGHAKSRQTLSRPIPMMFLLDHTRVDGHAGIGHSSVDDRCRWHLVAGRCFHCAKHRKGRLRRGDHTRIRWVLPAAPRGGVRRQKRRKSRIQTRLHRATRACRDRCNDRIRVSTGCTRTSLRGERGPACTRARIVSRRAAPFTEAFQTERTRPRSASGRGPSFTCAGASSGFSFVETRRREGPEGTPGSTSRGPASPPRPAAPGGRRPDRIRE